MSRSEGFMPGLTGSFSSPAADNPTGVMVETAYRHHGIAARYINCEVPRENLADAVLGAKAMGWLGFNCSLPHKVSVIEHLDALATSAEIIGAVNCVVAKGGRLVGENTDGKGFLASLRDVCDPEGRRIMLLGAGGAARAIAVEAALAGTASIVVVNRDASRGADLADLIATRTGARADVLPWNGPIQVPHDVDILVNATSIGLYPDVDARPEIDTKALRRDLIVADVIPNPPRSSFIRSAEAHGCRTVDGLGMLVNQAVDSIKLWTGHDVDPHPMARSLQAIFSPS